MRLLKHYATLVFITVVLSRAFALDSSLINYKFIGTIEPRNASKIEASNWSVGAETMDRDYTVYQYWKAYLGPLGFKKARIQGGWAKTEKSHGKYDWQWLDEIVDDMVSQGIEPWMCLCYGNNIYSQGGGIKLGAGLPSSGPALIGWCNWIRATVKRYGKYIDEWEVWNEPNLRGANEPEVYAEFLIRTAEVIRSVQPKAKILAMSLAGVDIKYATGVLKIVADQGKLGLIDQITYHPYSFNPDDSYAQVEKLRQGIAQFSPKITVRQGENGAPSARRKTKALRNYDWTELSQAKWALRRLLGDLGHDIESSYFSIMDMKYPDEINMKGLLKSQEDQKVEYAKPAYYALQNLAAVFDNQLVRIPQYQYTAVTSQSLSVFAYENKQTKAQVITIWLNEEIPSDSNKKTYIDFTISNGRFSEPCYVDLRCGDVYTIPDSQWSRKGKKYSFKSVPCYDCPILIADKSNIPIRSINK